MNYPAILKRTAFGGIVAVSLAFAVIAPVLAQAPRPDHPAQQIELLTGNEAFDPREPADALLGARISWWLVPNPAREFGGSALRVAADGEHFLSLTDKGNWLRGRIVYRDGRPVAIAGAEMAPIIGPDGRPLAKRGWYDTEALVEDGGNLYVAIERVNQILRFDYAKDGVRARGYPITVPSGMKTLPHNKSLECLVMVPKDLAPYSGPLAGTLIAISESGLDAHGNLLSFLIGGSGGVFTLKRTDEFDVSDCATTPRGELLVLERRFSWTRGLAVRIRSIPLATVKPGAIVDGPELAFADTNYQIDNMEGLSVHRSADGDWCRRLFQTTIFAVTHDIMQFTLVE
jgi:hypothetical protein